MLSYTKEGTCHVATSKKNKEGYATARYLGRTVLAHRLAYRLKNGKWPEVIRHTCDNRSCINPEHLIAGTHKDNVGDRVARGRSAKGELNGRSKLTRDSVMLIRDNTTESDTVLSRRFGVDRKVISRIRNGTSWVS